MKHGVILGLLATTLLNSVIAYGLNNSTSTEGGSNVCNALAMSGGGTYGAYEAGALWGMFYTNDTKENREKFKYNVVTGISAGSINTGGLALFEWGDEENAIRTLS